MKALPWIITLVAVLVAVYFWDQNRDQRVLADLAENQSAIKIKDADTRIAQRDTENARLQAKMDSARLHHAKTQESNLRSLNASKRRERLLRPDTLILTLVDTVYMAYDSLLEDLTLERDGIRRDCKTLVDSLLANAMDFRGIIDIKDLQNTALQKEFTKEKKRGKIFKWLFYAAAAGLIFESVKD